MQSGATSHATDLLQEDKYLDEEGNLCRLYPMDDNPELAKPIPSLEPLGRSEDRLPGDTPTGRGKGRGRRGGGHGTRRGKCGGRGHNIKKNSYESPLDGGAQAPSNAQSKAQVVEPYVQEADIYERGEHALVAENLPPMGVLVALLVNVYGFPLYLESRNEEEGQNQARPNKAGSNWCIEPMDRIG